MRKKVVKVALLSLVACGTPTAFVSCSDDDWKSPVETVETSVEGINNTIKQLDAQITALDGKIAENKAAAEAAAKAAADAMQKAQDAATSAEDAKKYAEEAAKKYAEEAAANALAQAAEQLKAEIEAVKALIEENKTAIAANKALIDGNTAEILRLAGLISGNSDLIAGNTASIEEAVKIIKENAANIQGNSDAIKEILADIASYKDENGKELTDIRAIIESLKNTQDENAAETANRLAEILEMIAAANGSIDGINGSIDGINGEISNINDICAGLSNSVAGINAAIEVIEGKCESLGLKIDDLEKALRDEMGTLEQTLAAQIANEAAAREAGDTALQKMIEDLSKQIEGLNLASNLEQFASFASETETQLAALKAFQAKMEGDFANLSSKVNGIEEIVNKNKSDIASLSTKLTETANQAAANAQDIAAQALLISANTQAISDLNQDIVGIRASIQELVNGDIKDLLDFKDAISNDIADINGTIDDIQNKINALEPLLNTMTLDQLRGLVFVPNAYVGGVESALSYHIWYNPLVENTSIQSDEYTYSNFKVYDFRRWRLTEFYTDGRLSYYYPITEVSYHMNPESASIKFEDLSIISNNAEVVTRSTPSSSITLDDSYNNGKGFKLEDGYLTVAIKGSDKGYTDMTENEYTDDRKMPVFALQAKVKGNVTSDENGNETEADNFVTSDFAMYVRKDVIPQSIKWNDKKYRDHFLTQTKTPVYSNSFINKTLDEFTTATVRYNIAPDDEDRLVLSDLLDIVYHDNRKGNTIYSWTGVEEWEKYGLKMNFKLINYSIDGQKNESSWATIDAETGEVTPNNEIDAVGHMPLVYVYVTREDSGEVLLDGFIKVLIMPADTYYKTEAIAYSKAYGKINFDCNGQSMDMPSDVDFYALIANATKTDNAPGYTKSAFIANYMPDLHDGSNQMKQYKRASSLFKENESPIGIVTYTNQSNVFSFKWVITGAEDKQALYAQAPEHTGYTYIRFVAKDGNNTVYPPIYIPLELTIKDKTVYSEPVAKVDKYWHRESAMLNAPVTGTSVAPISTALNVLWDNNNPRFMKSDGTVDDFTLPVRHWKYYFPATNNDISFKAPTIDVNDANNINAIEYSASTYWFYVDKDENEGLCGESASNADMEDLALLVDQDGEYENNALYVVSYVDNNKSLGIESKVKIAQLSEEGQITYEDKEDAFVFLNMFSSMGGENHPTADLTPLVAIVPWNDCKIAYKVENSDFKVTFLRPINVEFGTYQFTDAAGGRQNIFSMLKFSDWRNVKFESNQSLFKYYQISSITPDFEKMVDNLNSTGQYKPSALTTRNAFKYINNITTINYNDLTNSYGYITYDNLNATVSAFDVKIPFKVTYRLGEFTVYVTCHINPTMGS